jgi:hypothetical protein
VHQLNEADIPVIAWQLLPKQQGYWYNLDNAPEAAVQYAAFRSWTLKHGLRWAGLAVDLEPEYHEFQLLLSNEWWRLLPKMLRRAFDSESLRRAQASYGGLLAQMRSDGYSVESYQFPFMIEERNAGSTLLQRLFGLVDLTADRVGTMLYTSFERSLGPAILWSYAQDADIIAVGSTGGSAQVEGEAAPLNWKELSRDLLLAHQWGDDIAIYSLEGCVRQGFMARLGVLDWDRPISPPREHATQVITARKILRVILWVSAHPAIALGSLGGLCWLCSWWSSKRKWLRESATAELEVP